MASIDQIRASDGSGNANIATIQSSRAPASSTIDVDTVAGIPDNFMGSMGTPHTFQDPITAETITVISEATAVDFSGHVDGANLEIDDIAPGYTDAGSDIGDIVIIRPTTQYADNVADVLEVSHDDDGTIKKAAIVEGLDTYGVLGAEHIYTGNDTWTKPAGLKFVIVEVQAGGGSGGGGVLNGGSGAGIGGGGGAGGYGMSKLLAADLAATVAVTVGAGGAAVSTTAGNAGNTSSFGTHVVTAGGSGGGISNSAPPSISLGSNGGTVSAGQIQVPGAPGIAAVAQSATKAVSGSGGSSRFGGGGRAVGSNGGVDTTGIAGTGKGSGGGGAINFDNSSAAASGAGTDGIVIVREYY